MSGPIVGSGTPRARAGHVHHGTGRGENASVRIRSALPLGIASGLSASSAATVQLFGSDTPQCFSVHVDEIKKQGPNVFKAQGRE